MAHNHLIFNGNAQIHLYGQNALIPMHFHHQLLTSAIGVEGSELIVNEHRGKPLQSIENSSSKDYPDDFLKAFNQSARVEILYSPENQGLVIDLFEASTETETPILWMGVLENNIMPGYKADWEIFKTIDENNSAFCALIQTQSILSND